MKDFGEFDIEIKTEGFAGDKINIAQVMNVPIVIEKFSVGPSKFAEKGPRLDMQIEFEGKKRLLWISSNSLIELINKVPADGFPFKAKIVKDESTSRLIFKSVANNKN